ncbi:MAG: plasmid pRiA4b ORF-3 family protein, partial [Actinobacteria bacterium]|nr:plasmid pRiA4b ORF-3 family protein [Actinomycetota bacterium]
GYAEFLQILSDPDHPGYEERLEWIGGEFDPEQFDAEDVNAALVQAGGKEPGPESRAGYDETS